MHAELLLDARAILGESPFWDPTKQVLNWVDIRSNALHVFSESDGKDRLIDFDKIVTTVVTCRGGGLLLAMIDGIYLYDEVEGRLQPLGQPDDCDRERRFNDGKCDPRGRLFIGTCSQQAGRARLYRMDGRNRWRGLIDGLTISNSIAWSPDSSRMYLIDSPTKQVCGFDYCLETGDF
jgi:sugar lactone lactonase YvrE